MLFSTAEAPREFHSIPHSPKPAALVGALTTARQRHVVPDRVSSMPKRNRAAAASSSNSVERVLVLGTRGLKARHRHLQRDLLRLLPHGRPGSKLNTQDGLSAVVDACEDADCASALLLDARDPRRLYLWAAGCPDGPSAMLRVRNVHTVSELNVQARRCAGVRNLLVFDRGFDESADRRVLKALLIRTLSVPRSAVKKTATAAASSRSAADDDDAEADAAAEGDDAFYDEAPAAAAAPSASGPGVERVKHTLSFSWVDERIWMRVYRIGRGVTGAIDVEEIGPRLVLEPVRIIASGFGGAVLHQSRDGQAWRDEESDADGI